jgi:ribosomal protein L11 methyltransferase
MRSAVQAADLSYFMNYWQITIPLSSPASVVVAQTSRSTGQALDSTGAALSGTSEALDGTNAAPAGAIPADVLIALLMDLGFEGFEEAEDALHGFVREDRLNKEELHTALSRLITGYTLTAIPERNWNEEWEKNFDPVVVDGFCAVRAHFHAPIPGVKHDLLITPKMSFGTGHHATTYMMMESMQYLDFVDKRVLDFGTGTGVLAILAEKLGARTVLAIDHDDWSIENARENIAENHCSVITVTQMDTIPSEDKFDFVLANINKNVILNQLHAIRQQLRMGGVILLSGLLSDDFEDIEKEVVANNYSVSGRMTKGNWICLKVEKDK